MIYIDRPIDLVRIRELLRFLHFPTFFRNHHAEFKIDKTTYNISDIPLLKIIVIGWKYIYPRYRKASL